MPINTPNLLTLCRILVIPILVLVYYLPFHWANVLVAILFVLGGITDWLDGYLARKLNQLSAFGAFLDPVADKLMVTTALVLLATDERILSAVYNRELFAVVTAIIIGREIAISALREWMAELGSRANVAVSHIGKYKTIMQFIAISLLLFRESLFHIPVLAIGEVLLYVAAALTLWSMFAYVKAAWPSLVEHRG